MLLLFGRQTGEAWEPSKNNTFFYIQGILGRKILVLGPSEY
jgi:hypothetical protein